ncbi:hypothetical protein ACETWN_18335 [Aeromonas hydrophila]|uniref:hypothetical protein n=1 Tax=Aeromonas hydrophila TaxID=644 RepID=UPI0035A3410C
MKQGVAIRDEVAEQVERLACAYLAVRGDAFEHLGVVMKLDQAILTLAIHNNMVGALLESGKSLAEVAHLLNWLAGDGGIRPEGGSLLDDMNRSFCAEVRAMLEDGKDPLAELAKSNTRRAQQ